ncbi:MAG: isoprenylcysteine carboxylmethyltransferase family protein [Gemmatimonadota bacterium]|nr:isoprenylcysteine carboxylmethyltransferase family protein [Gemmatimonadota bacterium]
MKLMVRGLLGGVVQAGLLAVLLLIPAGLVPGGTWTWTRGLAFVGVYFLLLEVAIVVMARLAPASLEARMTKPASDTQPFADRIATSLILLSSALLLIFVPFDVFYLRLFPAPTPPVSGIGGALAVAGFAIIVTAIYQNAFALPYVEDQTDRGQTLVDTGLYGFVRHPLYMGILPYLIGTCLWLESFAAVIVAVLPVAALVARIAVEEKTLRETLPGYVEYTERVRYRMIPLVW